MEFARVVEEAEVTRSDVDRHIDLAGLQGHRARVRIVDRGDLYRLIRHFAAPVVRVLLHDGLFLHEGFADIRPRADRSLLCKIAFPFTLRIDDKEQRISEISEHTRRRLIRCDLERLPVRRHVRILKECCRPRILCKRTLKRCLDRLGCERSAVREFNVANLERPCQLVIADLPTLGKPRLNIHLFIELCKGFAHAVTHNDPAESVLCRLE